jgi:hypothetical protein
MIAKTTLTVLLTLLTLTVVVSATFADEKFDRIMYGGDFYDKERQITYWGIAGLTISDYHSGSGDAEDLKLVVKNPNERFRSPSPNAELLSHFTQAFKRYFGDLPFNDLEKGRHERFSKFYEQHQKLDHSEFRERWTAAEEARRRSLYGGRAGAVECSVAVKRRAFPVLYEARCGISADDDLGSRSWREAKDIGFSSPEHIAGEIKAALSELLKG